MSYIQASTISRSAELQSHEVKSTIAHSGVGSIEQVNALGHIGVGSSSDRTAELGYARVESGDRVALGYVGARDQGNHQVELGYARVESGDRAALGYAGARDQGSHQIALGSGRLGGGEKVALIESRYGEKLSVLRQVEPGERIAQRTGAENGNNRTAPGQAGERIAQRTVVENGNNRTVPGQAGERISRESNALATNTERTPLLASAENTALATRGERGVLLTNAERASQITGGERAALSTSVEGRLLTPGSERGAFSSSAEHIVGNEQAALATRVEGPALPASVESASLVSNGENHALAISGERGSLASSGEKPALVAESAGGALTSRAESSVLATSGEHLPSATGESERGVLGVSGERVAFVSSEVQTHVPTESEHASLATRENALGQAERGLSARSGLESEALPEAALAAEALRVESMSEIQAGIRETEAPVPPQRSSEEGLGARADDDVRRPIFRPGEPGANGENERVAEPGETPDKQILIAQPDADGVFEWTPQTGQGAGSGSGEGRGNGGGGGGGNGGSGGGNGNGGSGRNEEGAGSEHGGAGGNGGRGGQGGQVGAGGSDGGDQGRNGKGGAGKPVRELGSMKEGEKGFVFLDNLRELQKELRAMFAAEQQRLAQRKVELNRLLKQSKPTAKLLREVAEMYLREVDEVERVHLEFAEAICRNYLEQAAWHITMAQELNLDPDFKRDPGVTLLGSLADKAMKSMKDFGTFDENVIKKLEEMLGSSPQEFKEFLKNSGMGDSFGSMAAAFHEVGMHFTYLHEFDVRTMHALNSVSNSRWKHYEAFVKSKEQGLSEARHFIAMGHAQGNALKETAMKLLVEARGLEALKQSERMQRMQLIALSAGMLAGSASGIASMAGSSASSATSIASR